MTRTHQPSGERSRGPKPTLGRPAAALRGSVGEEVPCDRTRRVDSQPTQLPASGGRKRSPAAAAVSEQDPPYYQGGQIDTDIQKTIVQEDEIGLHWATITGPLQDQRAIRDLLLATFGETMKSGSGGAHYAGSWLWPTGVTLSIEHSINRSFKVMVPGNACDLMGGPKLWAFLRQLFLGDRKCTRFDIYRDQRGQNIRLIDDAYQSCCSQELCHVRRYKQHDGRLSDTKTRIDHGLELGSRSSNRYVRIYDKGLESGCALHRQWVRFEVEFKDEPAHEAAQRVLSKHSYEAGMVEAAALLIGAVDFRITTGDAHIKRRKRPTWWARYCGDLEASRPRVERRESDWRSKMKWFKNQVAPTVVACAIRARCTVGEMFEALAGDAQPSAAMLTSPITSDIAHEYQRIKEANARKRKLEQNVNAS